MVSYRDIKISTYQDVYGPEEDSFLLAENMKIPEGAKVLDVGTGTGFLALAAAEYASSVVGVDVNPKAVELARKNAEANGIRNVKFLIGDLFSAIREDERFDVIIFNPPYLPVGEYDALGRSWSGGAGGLEVVKKFISAAPKHLNEDGEILLLLSSLNDMRKVRMMLREAGLLCEVAARKKMFFEELVVVRCFFPAI
jgi:release factor glutamine methyltransferase